MNPPSSDSRPRADGATPVPGQRVLGDFAIERELGRGGMGIVWLATQRSLGRRVALKTLPDFALLDNEAVARFRREAEATGRIAHPGIVPVYGTGESDGVQWFAMEFVDGPPLSSLIEELGIRQVEKLEASLVDEVQKGDRWPTLREPKGGVGNRYVRSCARLCAEVANALSAAHRERVIHRDIKPSNIMIHPAGRPVVLDFGLARDEQSAQLTRSGDQLGTPSYMAPEQARGVRKLDARVDVYALGAVLYELLTLQPPFHGATAAEISHQILTEDAIPVQKRNPNVPVDLAAVVHRCLSKDADDRYPSMEGLEADLRAFLEGKSVSARLPSAMARLQSRLQRHRKVLVGSVGASVAAVAIAVLAGVVDDRGDVLAGHELLGQARVALVERGEADRARDLYERAAALTKQSDLVREARRRDFAEAFETWYSRPPQGPQALRRFAAVFDESEKEQLKEQLERLDGRGSIRFATRTLEQATRTLEVRRATDDGLEPEWRPVAAGQAVPLGEYLVRATATDGRTSVLRAAVELDRTTQLAPRYLDAKELPAGTVAVVDPDDGRVLAGAECEVTRREWREWLAQLPEAVRAEMTPSGLPDDASKDELPVRGLSFHQARAFAQTHGAHLPTAHELWLLGSAGLAQLSTPWGGPVDAARVVADPFQRSEAEPVRSLEQGRSPLGAFHVLGNAAEVLAAERGALLIGGGSFADDPKTLRFQDRTVPTESLASVFAPHAAAGLRLFRFVTAPDQPEAAQAARTRRAELERSPGGAVFHDWTLEQDGRMTCQLELVGAYDGGSRDRMLYLDTKGFLQVRGSLRALDGHGRALEVAAGAAPGAEQSIVHTELPAALRAGQGFRFKVSAELQPGAGLLPDRDGYVLRLPLQRGHGAARVHTLVLPHGASVVEVAPEALRWQQDGRTVLSWEQTATAQIEAAVVRFAIDGSFGNAIAERAAAQDRCQRLLSAWNARSPELEAVLDADFVQLPGPADRTEALRRDRDERITMTDLVDVVRTGAIESCEVRVDWRMTDHAGRPFELRDFPLLLQWRHEGGAVRAVRMQPFTLADLGRYENARGEASGYAHDGLRVRIAPVAGAVLVRTQDELCELQVELTHAEGTVQVTGCFAGANEIDDAIRFRLTNGASVLGRGRMLGETRTDDGLVQDWLFAKDGRTTRERWTFAQKGRRHVLVRAAASAADEAEAQRRFAVAAAQAFFAAVPAAVKLD